MLTALARLFLTSAIFDMFVLELRSAADGTIKQIHKRAGQWCDPKDALITLRLNSGDVELRAPAHGQVTRVWAAEGQLMATGECLVTFESPG